jgi:serine/threonine protein kinase
MYSLGVIMWEALTGLTPWDGIPVDDMKTKVINAFALESRLLNFSF